MTLVLLALGDGNLILEFFHQVVIFFAPFFGQPIHNLLAGFHFLGDAHGLAHLPDDEAAPLRGLLVQIGQEGVQLPGEKQRVVEDRTVSFQILLMEPPPAANGGGFLPADPVLGGKRRLSKHIGVQLRDRNLPDLLGLFCRDCVCFQHTVPPPVKNQTVCLSSRVKTFHFFLLSLQERKKTPAKQPMSFSFRDILFL